MPNLLQQPRFPRALEPDQQYIVYRLFSELRYALNRHVLRTVQARHQVVHGLGHSQILVLNSRAAVAPLPPSSASAPLVRKNVHVTKV